MRYLPVVSRIGIVHAIVAGVADAVDTVNAVDAVVDTVVFLLLL